MANNYFQFKQFRIDQDKCSMKVGTDGTLLGAWTNPPQTGFILDVGCGTGLLMLMMAQKSTHSMIDGIEIDIDAAHQAAENKNHSKWRERISITNNNFFTWAAKWDKKYDLIICNPPFYNQGPKSSSTNRDIARQNKFFNLAEFIQTSKQILTPQGAISLILPAEQKLTLLEIADSNFVHANKICHIFPTPLKPSHRFMVQLFAEKTDLQEENLIVEINGRHQYSEQYRMLTKDFYLNI